MVEEDPHGRRIGPTLSVVFSQTSTHATLLDTHTHACKNYNLKYICKWLGVVVHTFNSVPAFKR